MNLWQVIILGAVQGATEFIPVSSSGHLILVLQFFGWADSGLSFDIILHFGTLVAILFYFWKIWQKLIVGFFKGEAASRKLVFGIIIGTTPAIVVGYFSEKIIGQYFRSAFAVGILMILAGVGFITIEWWRSKKQEARAKEVLSLKDYFVIGLIQSIALLPGVSRSGTTIAAGMSRKLARREAAEVSFLLAVPAILGATVYDLVKNYNVLVGIKLPMLAIGFLTACIVGYLSIRFLMSYLNKHKLNIFAYYLFVVGFLAIIFSLWV